MAQAQTKGDKHILVMNDVELEAVRNGAILSAKFSAQTEGVGMNLGLLKASIEILDAVNPIFDSVSAAKKTEPKAKA